MKKMEMRQYNILPEVTENNKDVETSRKNKENQFIKIS